MEIFHQLNIIGFILSLALILFSCQSSLENYDYELSGSWYFLSNDDDYCEIYFKGKYSVVRCSNSELHFPIAHSYKLERDVVMRCLENTFEKSEINIDVNCDFKNWFKIINYSYDSMKIQFLHTKEICIFIRSSDIGFGSYFEDNLIKEDYMDDIKLFLLREQEYRDINP